MTMDQPEDSREPLRPAGWPPPPSQAPGGKEPTPAPGLAMDRRYLALLVIFLGCLFYFTVTTVSLGGRAHPTLVKAFVAFRHGTRSPCFTYNNDPYNKDDEKYWPDGPGELTKAGKFEAYELGGKLRLRYNDFVGDYYKPKEFRAFSTLIERTMMSAQLVLASFFQPQGYQEWFSSMNWQPIPVYPDPIANATSGTNCPRFIAEFKRNLKQVRTADLGLGNDEARMLQENTGEPNELPFSLFARVWDTVYFQDKANLPTPEWLNSIYPHKMNTAALNFLTYYLAGTHYQRLLVLGPYGKGLMNYFTDSSRKMELHSWHDLNVLGLMLLLGIELESFPEPTCAIAIELHNRDGEQYFEAYYYPNSKAKEPTQMTMACGKSCHISELINMSRPYLRDDYKELCNSANEVPTGPLGLPHNLQ